MHVYNSYVFLCLVFRLRSLSNFSLHLSQSKSFMLQNFVLSDACTYGHKPWYSKCALHNTSLGICFLLDKIDG